MMRFPKNQLIPNVACSPFQSPQAAAQRSSNTSTRPFPKPPCMKIKTPPEDLDIELINDVISNSSFLYPDLHAPHEEANNGEVRFTVPIGLQYSECSSESQKTPISDINTLSKCGLNFQK